MANAIDDILPFAVNAYSHPVTKNDKKLLVNKSTVQNLYKMSMRLRGNITESFACGIEYALNELGLDKKEEQSYEPKQDKD